MQPEIVNLKMRQKRPNASENGQRKIVKTERCEYNDECGAGSEDKDETKILHEERSDGHIIHLSDFQAILKASVCKAIKKIEQEMKRTLQLKDSQYAILKHEKETLDLEKHVVGEKHDKLVKENDEWKFEFRIQEEKRVDHKKKVEDLVEALKMKLMKKNTEVQHLRLEINVTRQNENILQGSLDSMEVDTKQTNKNMVEKDDNIEALKSELEDKNHDISLIQGALNDLTEENVFNSQQKVDLETKVGSLEMENDMYSKSLLSKDLELENLANEFYTTKEIMKDLKIDIKKKEHKIEQSECLKLANEMKIKLLEDTESDLTEKYNIKTECIVVLQKNLEQKENDLKDDKLNSDLVNHDLKLTNKVLKKEVQILEQQDSELRSTMKEFKDKTTEFEVWKSSTLLEKYCAEQEKENLLKDLEEKNYKINDQSEELKKTESKFRQKVEDLHLLSKSYADLSKKYDLNLKINPELSNKTTQETQSMNTKETKLGGKLVETEVKQKMLADFKLQNDDSEVETTQSNCESENKIVGTKGEVEGNSEKKLIERKEQIIDENVKPNEKMKGALTNKIYNKLKKKRLQSTKESAKSFLNTTAPQYMNAYASYNRHYPTTTQPNPNILGGNYRQSQYQLGAQNIPFQPPFHGYSNPSPFYNGYNHYGYSNY